MGKISSRTEFFFPDDKLTKLPEEITLTAAKNQKRGIQLLAATGSKQISVTVEGPAEIHTEIYRMHKIPVEYNTGDGEAQGGGMVLVDRPLLCPPYALRLAPFWVYDCLEERKDGMIETADGRAAVYLCFSPSEHTKAGIYELHLKIREESDVFSCKISLTLMEAEIPERGFSVSNWFSIQAMERCHGVKRTEEAFNGILQTYIRAMRRTRQTHFFLELDESILKNREKMIFDFSEIRPVIAAFFEAGFETLEIGPLLSRGFRSDGSPDMFTDRFTCMAAPELPFESEEGYRLTLRFLQALGSFLRENGWDRRTVVHIHDEPDIHYQSQETLEARRRQYYQAVCLLKRELPHSRVIEAVDSAAFAGGIDIWVTGTAGYEKHKTSFDGLHALSEEIWNYVCCGPEGHWLNRFLDFSLIKGRLLFWGFAKNEVSGYLHWGLNRFPEGMDPYQATSCPNPTGIGTAFPCGDAFIVYPGPEGARISLRLEAQRQGVEDYLLLKLLREKNPVKWQELIRNIFRNNQDYEEDPQIFDQNWEQLLMADEDLKFPSPLRDKVAQK